jgi:hypothetical protein
MKKNLLIQRKKADRFNIIFSYDFRKESLILGYLQPIILEQGSKIDTRTLEVFRDID